MQSPEKHGNPARASATIIAAAKYMPGPAPCASTPCRDPVAYESTTIGQKASMPPAGISDCTTLCTWLDITVVTLPGNLQRSSVPCVATVMSTSMATCCAKPSAPE